MEVGIFLLTIFQFGCFGSLDVAVATIYPVSSTIPATSTEVNGIHTCRQVGDGLFHTGRRLPSAESNILRNILEATIAPVVKQTWLSRSRNRPSGDVLLRVALRLV